MALTMSCLMSTTTTACAHAHNGDNGNDCRDYRHITHACDDNDGNECHDHESSHVDHYYNIHVHMHNDGN
ncbi:hypothetical protein SCLCIDRAFT_1222676, partial [Scleroderma citrinum Foug A]